MPGASAASLWDSSGVFAERNDRREISGTGLPPDVSVDDVEKEPRTPSSALACLFEQGLLELNHADEAPALL